MLRKAVLALGLVLSLGSIATPLVADAQQTAKTWRIGYLAGGGRPPDGAPPAALRQALKELGYEDGRNVVYAGRWSEGKDDSLPVLAAELVGLKVDLIVAFGGGQSAEAAKAATSTIPIVFALAGDPVGIGLVASLSRPGGNATGISAQATELSAKRLELLKELAPTVGRVAVLWNTDDRAMTLRYQEIEKAARVLHVTVQPLGVREPEDFETAFSAMTRERPDALLLITDALTIRNRKRVLDYAAAHSIPDMYEHGWLVREGGLVSYGADENDVLRRAAVYVDRILKGAKPSDLPVEQPTRYYLLVNRKTAAAVGLTIPQSVLLRVDEVIQ
jgi:putative ABC transport system substrate-binding protein